MLGQKFFERNAVRVARELIGKFLCTPRGSFMIVETEAYEGTQDLASHASRGERPRNKVMFGQANTWYIYFTYGMHYMLNIVCGKAGHPAAILIRGVEGTVGPGRLTKKLGIDKKLNGKKSSIKTGLWIEAKRQNKDEKLDTLKISDSKKLMYGRKLKIKRTPRIGVNYSGPIWSKKKYRFVLEEFETKKFK